MSWHEHTSITFLSVIMAIPEKNVTETTQPTVVLLRQVWGKKITSQIKSDKNTCHTPLGKHG